MYHLRGTFIFNGKLAKTIKWVFLYQRRKNKQTANYVQVTNYEKIQLECGTEDNEP